MFLFVFNEIFLCNAQNFSSARQLLMNPKTPFSCVEIFVKFPRVPPCQLFLREYFVLWISSEMLIFGLLSMENWICCQFSKQPFRTRQGWFGLITFKKRRAFRKIVFGPRKRKSQTKRNTSNAAYYSYIYSLRVTHLIDCLVSMPSLVIIVCGVNSFRFDRSRNVSLVFSVVENQQMN